LLDKAPWKNLSHLIIELQLSYQNQQWGEQEVGKIEENWINYPFLHKLHSKNGKINKMQSTKLNMPKNSPAGEQKFYRPSSKL
jgi:hypothetical protein